MLKEAEQEYKDLLRQLEEDDNVTREDLEAFKKNALIHKSVLEVRRRAQAMQEVRRSPERYRQVESKIGQNIRTSMKVSSQRYGGVNASNTSAMGSSQMFQSINKLTVTKREKPFDITDEEMARIKEMQLSEKSTQKISDRETQIHQAEQYLEQLLQELKDRRPFHERLQAYKSSAADPASYGSSAVKETSNATPATLNGQSPVKAFKGSPPKSQSVQRQAREKVGMRLKEKPTTRNTEQQVPPAQAQTQTFKVSASKPEKQEFRLHNLDKHKPVIEEEAARAEKSGSRVISVEDRGSSQRLDLQPPEGADGCVLFVEKRTQKEKVASESY